MTRVIIRSFLRSNCPISYLVFCRSIHILLESEDAFPVGFEADDRPALLFRLVVERLGGITDLIDVLPGSRVEDGRGSV